MREAVEKLVKLLVDDQVAVEVAERSERQSTIISVRVAPGDIGKIIGREGRTIKALRSLVFAASQRQAHRFVLEIVE